MNIITDSEESNNTIGKVDAGIFYKKTNNIVLYQV